MSTSRAREDLLAWRGQLPFMPSASPDAALKITDESRKAEQIAEIRSPLTFVSASAPARHQPHLGRVLCLLSTL